MTHEIGHAIGLADVDLPHGSGGFVSRFYDDNFDSSTSATAGETLSNSFADVIDTVDPNNSPGLMTFEPCRGPDDRGFCRGIDVRGVNVLMESSPTNGEPHQGLHHDEYAGRQFLYPYVRVPGDFDADKELTVQDIDLLSQEIRMDDPRQWFDLTGDAAISQADRDVWVHDLKGTYFGDANLDGEFNADDLIAVFQAGQYENDVDGDATWATGDWSGDSEFDSNDLVAALQDGGFEQGPQPAISAVPEPSTAVLCILAIASISCLRLRRYGFRLSVQRQHV